MSYNNEELERIAHEIVDRLLPRYPWEEVHTLDVEYVLSKLKEIHHEHV